MVENGVREKVIKSEKRKKCQAQKNSLESEDLQQVKNKIII